jgi:ABC-type transport system involved in multi-copper enzyme maturation permease subunit
LIKAILGKDLALLKNYIRATVVLTLGCYLFASGLAIWATSYDENAMKTIANRAFMSLDGGSQLGFIATGLVGALLAGSAISLERSDRSVEFLACLPPTRRQNLISKAMIVGSILLLMIGIHVVCNFSAQLLIPYVPSEKRPYVPDLTDVTTFVSIIVSMVGGAWGFASFMKSNGGPIILGLGTPFLVLSLVVIIGWSLGIKSEDESFQVRYTAGGFVLGLTLGLIGSYHYLTRSEP